MIADALRCCFRDEHIVDGLGNSFKVISFFKLLFEQCTVTDFRFCPLKHFHVEIPDFPQTEFKTIDYFFHFYDRKTFLFVSKQLETHRMRKLQGKKMIFLAKLSS
jgi:hypothetical protein